MKNSLVHVRSGIALFILITLAVVSVTPALSQTTPASIVFTAVNVNESFPEVQVQVKVLDAENGFVPGLNANQFALKEDGQEINIENVSNASLPLNLRVVFVVDELAIGSNASVVREAIQAFAENQMQSGDSVIVLAASDRNETKVIVPLTSDPQQVLDGIANYNPVSANGTDLLQTVNQGLDELSALNENIVGLNKMVVFSISINDQLDLNETIAKAAGLAIPVHTVLLGADDINGALGRLARETQAGNGVILSADINDLDSVLDSQRDENQYLITYRSQVNQPGDHELTLTINNSISKNVTFTLDELEAPLATITSPSANTEIVRTESLFNQDSDSVQPTEQTIAVEITFPDGHPRQIIQENTALVVNGKAVGPATTIRDNGEDVVILEFTWDLRAEQIPGVNPISIVVEAEDELGLKSTTESLPVAVEYIIFDAVCPELVSTYAPALCSNYNLILPLASFIVAIIALILVIVYLRRNPKIREKVKERLGTMMTSMGGTRIGGNPGATRMVEPLESAKATLEVMEGKSGTNETLFRLKSTMTLGRSSEHAELVFQSNLGDRSAISRLHCTILEKGDFFELRDEGSSNGTFLNGARIRSGDLYRLGDGDIIELARVQDGGVKLKFQAVSSSPHMGTRLVSPTSKDTDDLPKDGYTPTKLMD